MIITRQPLLSGRAAWRAVVLAVALVSAVLVAPGSADARTLPAAPKVTIKVGSGGSISMPSNLRSSRYQFEVKGRGGVQLVKVARGYTKTRFMRDLNRSERGDSAADRSLAKNVRFFGGVFLEPGQSGRFWETLYAGTYWALPLDDSPASISQIKAVRVTGKVRATAWPGSNGVLTMKDDRLTGPRRLPTSGKLLVRNRGGADNLMLVVRMAPGKTARDLMGADENVVEALSTPVAMLSPKTQMLWGYTLPRGEYAVLSIVSLFFYDSPDAVVPLTVR